jgi:hypothetical protein
MPNKNKIARPIFSGNSAKGISGISPQGAIKKISTLYGDLPDTRARVAGRYVSLQSMPGGKYSEATTIRMSVNKHINAIWAMRR